MVTAIPTQAEYERREALAWIKRERELETTPLSERKEAQKEYFEALRDNPEWVAEQCEWCLNGSYGFHPYKLARQIVRSKRGNRVAALAQLVASANWQCTQSFAIAAYKKLTKEQQDRVNGLIQSTIDEWLADPSHLL